MRVLMALVLASLMALLAGGAQAQLADRKALTLADVKKIMAAAEEEAIKNKWNVVIAVVDETGNLLGLQRMDDAQVGSVDVAIGKAVSAARFKRPTKAFEDAVAGGRNAVLALTGAMPIEGGIPIMFGGRVIGAVGVSGVTAQQDGQIAAAGVAIIK